VPEYCIFPRDAEVDAANASPTKTKVEY
jgi:hypothetical protein